MSRGRPRVLVLTGTSDHPFPRLLDALPALVRDGVASEVRVQRSLPVPAAPGIVTLGMLSREAVERELAEADVEFPLRGRRWLRMSWGLRGPL